MARRLGAVRMTIEADPGAAPFYEHMGAQYAGFAPSQSIPGRMLPRMQTELKTEQGNAKANRADVLERSMDMPSFPRTVLAGALGRSEKCQ
jgi:hypothetical protein